MRAFISVLSLVFLITLSVSALAVDEKKIEKKIWIQEGEKKTGLGVMVAEAESKDQSGKSGAAIVEVFAGSEAEAIGLKKGDIITGINNQPVSEPSDLLNALKDLDEGQEISLAVVRDGETKNFKALMKPFSGHAYAFHGDGFPRDVNFGFIPTPHAENFYRYMQVPEIAGAENKGGYLGVQVKSLSDQLQQYFEVSNGVLIEEVMKDSPAEKAGLKAGDVITAINDRKIEDPQDLVRTVNYYNPDEEVEVIFTRKGAEKEAKAVLTKKPGFEWTEGEMMGPHGLKVIKEGDHDAIFIEEGKAPKVIEIDEGDGKKTVEINKEILIL
jgi:serine protease Do